VPQLAATGPAAAGHKPFWGDLRYDLPLLSRRTAIFILIAGLHVLLIYAFASGFAQHVAASIPELMHAVTIEDAARPQPPPPTPQFRPTHITDRVAPVVVDPPPSPLVVEDGPGPQTPAPSLTTSEVPPVTRTVERVPGGTGKDFPITDDYYPSVSRRISETGAADVQVCVDTRGDLTADPALVKSSGHPRIDAAALNLAKAGSGHYRPSTEDGLPVNSCYPYRIRFRLDD
jgi:outer membrane biosynthesis protein TonB